MAKESESGAFRVKATNRKALRDFEIEERLEAGLVLLGSEIKSIRDGRVNLREAYAAVEGGEVFIYGMNIPPYLQASYFGHDPLRPRKLLLHRDQIKRLAGQVAEKGYTLVPIRLYLRDGKAKLELGLARGRRMHDKRREIAKKDAEREMARALRDRQRGGEG